MVSEKDFSIIAVSIHADPRSLIGRIYVEDH